MIVRVLKLITNFSGLESRTLPGTRFAAMLREKEG
jgi:hypothetical protein